MHIYIHKTEHISNTIIQIMQISTHFNRNITIINIIKLIIITTVTITLICVLVKAKNRRQKKKIKAKIYFIVGFIYLIYVSLYYNHRKYQIFVFDRLVK